MVIVDVHSPTLVLIYSSMNSGESNGDPRYGLPCEVIFTPKSVNMFAALWMWLSTKSWIGIITKSGTFQGQSVPPAE